MSSHKLTLTYFPGRGRAEVSRLLLAEAKVDYADVRVNDNSDLAKAGKLPFGQLPILEWDGHVVAQSWAIARFLARKNGLYGKTEEDGVFIDQIVDGTADVAAARNNAKTPEEKATLESTTLPKWLGYFEKLFKSGKGTFFVGDSLTLADIAVFNSLDILVNPEHGSYPKCLDSFATLREFYNRIAARPNIAAWLKSRPKTSY